MLRIGPNASSDEQSAINIRTDTQRIGVQKNPTGEYILDVSGSINCDSIFVGGAQLSASSGSGLAGVWTQDDTTGDISYGDGNVFIGEGLDVSGYLKLPFGSDDVSSATYEGYIRYNDVSNVYQGYDVSNHVWSSLGAGSTFESITESAEPLYNYLRIYREDYTGNDIILNGLQVWDNSVNLISSGTIDFYNSDDATTQTVAIEDEFANVSNVVGESYVQNVKFQYIYLNTADMGSWAHAYADVFGVDSFLAANLYRNFYIKEIQVWVDVSGTSTNVALTSQGGAGMWVDPSIEDETVAFEEGGALNNTDERFVISKAINNAFQLNAIPQNATGYDNTAEICPTASLLLKLPAAYNVSDLQSIVISLLSDLVTTITNWNVKILDENQSTIYETAKVTIDNVIETASDPTFTSNTATGNIYRFDGPALTSDLLVNSVNTIAGVSNLSGSVSIVEVLNFDISTSTIGSYAQIAFTSPLPNYNDLQAIYMVSPNTTDYELSGCKVQLLTSQETILAESDVLGSSANYLLRGPVGITATSGTVSATESYTNTNSETGALFSSPSDIVAWSDFSTYVDDVSLNQNDINLSGNTITIDGDLNVTSVLYVSETITTNGDLNVGGTAYASGSALTSDDRLKHNEEDISGLELITQLHPQKYLKTRMMYAENYTLTEDASGNYTNLKQGDRVDEEMGIIAQDVLNIPELSFCVTDSTPYAVNYNNLFVLSIQAIKELKAEKDALQTSHDALKALLQSKGLID